MPSKAAVQLLLHRYHDANIDDYLSEGMTIVNRLGNLALAIDQASAYMDYIRLPLNKLSTFLSHYDSQREKVLEHTTSTFWRYMKISARSEQEIAVSAFTTWEMSLRQLLEKYEHGDLVSHFLTLAAFFAPMPVNESLFRLHLQAPKHWVTWAALFSTTITANLNKAKFLAVSNQESMTTSAVPNEHAARVARLYNMFGWRYNDSFHSTSAPFAVKQATSQMDQSMTIDFEYGPWNPESFWRLINGAFEISLIQGISPSSESSGASFQFHSLIRDWLQLRIATEKRQAFTREAIDVVVSSIKVYIETSSDAQMKSTILLHMDAVLVCNNEFFDSQHGLCRDISACDNGSWFASFYWDQGRYSEAEQIYRQEIEVRERVQGKEHPVTLASMNNLAVVLTSRGKYSEAEQMHRQIIEVCERVLGKEHLDTLASINNLAIVLTSRGKHSEAEQIHRQVIAVRERVQGKEHPDTLTSMNNLAMVLSSQSNYSEAQSLQLQAFRCSLTTLGLEHPTTGTFLANLLHTLECEGLEIPQIESILQNIAVEVGDSLLHHSNCVGQPSDLASIVMK